MNKAYAMVSALLLAGAGAVQAQPIWPDTDGDGATNWQVVQIGGADYVDVQGDTADTRWAAVDPDTTDLVGGIDINGNYYPTAYWFSDYDDTGGTVTGHLMFRVRLDNPYDVSGTNNQTNFAALLNIDGDDGVDIVVQLDDQFHDRVEINVTEPPEVGPGSDPPWGASNTLDNDPNAQEAVGPDTVYARSMAVDDGSEFHKPSVGPPSDQDYFIDWAIPWDQFLTYTGLTYDGLGQFGAPFDLAFGTSSSHATMNKDKPDYLGWDTTERIVPAPGTLALLALGIPLLARRRRSLKAV